MRPVGQRLRSRLERLLAALTPPAPPDWCPAWTIPEDFYALGWP